MSAFDGDRRLNLRRIRHSRMGAWIREVTTEQVFRNRDRVKSRQRWGVHRYGYRDTVWDSSRAFRWNLNLYMWWREFLEKQQSSSEESPANPRERVKIRITPRILVAPSSHSDYSLNPRLEIAFLGESSHSKLVAQLFLMKAGGVEIWVGKEEKHRSSTKSWTTFQLVIAGRQPLRWWLNGRAKPDGSIDNCEGTISNCLPSFCSFRWDLWFMSLHKKIDD